MNGQGPLEVAPGHDAEQLPVLLPQVIQDGHPCHLYFDLEFNVACNPTLQGDAMVQDLIALVADALR